MTIQYLYRATRTAEIGQQDLRDTVQKLLTEIEAGGEDSVKYYARKFDLWDGEILVSEDTVKAAAESLHGKIKDDIRFAHDNIRRFAEAQKDTISECELEIVPGLIAGQRQLRVSAAGCYVPGGRYSHIASALMTVTTAKVAGVEHIVACSPPKPSVGIPPAILFTLELCGAEKILNLGGVQGIAAMTFGMFGLPKADIPVGPGNQYVAEAKRILFGRVGIDMFAGPTDSLILAALLHESSAPARKWDTGGQ